MAIDASFGEDVRIMLSVFETATKLKFPIAATTFSERFKIPMAQPGDVVLEAQQAPAVLPAADPNAEPNAAQDVTEFGEQGIVTVYDGNGRAVNFFPDAAVYTENRGIVRASNLRTGDIPVVDRERVAS